MAVDPEQASTYGCHHKPRGFPSLPELRLPESIDPDSDSSVDQDASLKPEKSITTSLATSIAGSPVPNTLDSDLLGIISPDDDLNVREKTLEELDQELVSTEDTTAGPQYQPTELDKTIGSAARTGNGLPFERLEPGLGGFARPPSEKSTITDLGARGREIATSTEEPEPSISDDEFSEDETHTMEIRLLYALHKIPGHSEKKGFFPDETLRVLINKSSVNAELQKCYKGIMDYDTIERLTEEICDNTAVDGHQVSLKKIFTILVLCEKLSTINLLIKEKVTDLDLPLRKVPRRGRSPNIFDLARKGDSEGTTKPLKCFEDWSPLATIKFEEWQWTTLAPFFHRGQRKNVGHFALQDEVPLPFTADSRYGNKHDSMNGQDEVEGGFSSVFKADIHPQHHGFGEHKFTCQSFAIKCLLSRNREEFRHEADMLMNFSDDTHKHLISLLATYEQHKKFYLIFPYAAADLEAYWEFKNPRPSLNHETVRWMATQCWGLAEALSKIHKYNSNEWMNHPAHRKTWKRHQTQTGTRPRYQMFGRHGDIKPQNVLWFQNRHDSDDNGTLKITDFGLTEIDARLTIIYEPDNKAAVSPSYRAPEFDLVGRRGRSHDIWALGCLYLDFVAWLLGGWELVQNFARKRQSRDPMWSDIPTDTFFEIVKCKDDDSVAVMVKETVSRFIDDLHRHDRCTEYLHDFLNLIQMEMLVIKPPICNPEERGRVEIGDVVKRLRDMLEKTTDPAYALEPASWDRVTTVIKAFETDISEATMSVLQHKALPVYDGQLQRKACPASCRCMNGQ